MPTLRFFRLLLWVQWRSLLARVRGLRKRSPLLPFLLVGFVVGYLLLGYFLFHFGLQYVTAFPAVGALLTQRILFLIFGFFFVMLVFSNLIIGYSTLFKNRETNWFLTLPIRHCASLLGSFRFTKGAVWAMRYKVASWRRFPPSMSLERSVFVASIDGPQRPFGGTSLVDLGAVLITKSKPHKFQFVGSPTSERKRVSHAIRSSRMEPVRGR